MNNIQKMILSKDMKKKKLAKAMGVGPTMISHYLNGSKLPRVDRAILMAKELETTVEFLFANEQEEKDEKAGKTG